MGGCNGIHSLGDFYIAMEHHNAFHGKTHELSMAMASSSPTVSHYQSVATEPCSPEPWNHALRENIQPLGGADWNMFFSIQLGMSSSQVTFIFFRGVGIPPRFRLVISEPVIQKDGRLPMASYWVY